MDVNYADKVAQFCYKFYNNVPKSCKPNKGEWTVITCILKIDQSSGDLTMLAFGSGTKCVGEHFMSASGNVLNDSHAEIMVRRGFLLYLYDQVECAHKNKDSIFIVNDSAKCVLKETYNFIFFSSQVPCGDCSIMLKDNMSLKRKLPDSHIGMSKRPKFSHDVDFKEADIHRTGAKCLPDSRQDSGLKGKAFHELGQVRTKPGRGDRTLSVSCSDKIARWLRVGIQGALLSHLIENPVVIKVYVFGGGIPCSEESLNRALIFREELQNESSMETSNGSDGPYCAHNHKYGHLLEVPIFLQSNLQFVDGKPNKTKPSPVSVVYGRTSAYKMSFEITVGGQKQGTAKKNASKLSAASSISKSKLFARFISIIEGSSRLRETLRLNTEDLKGISYRDAKNRAADYQRCWRTIRSKFFINWTKKPNMWTFSMNDLSSL